MRRFVLLTLFSFLFAAAAAQPAADRLLRAHGYPRADTQAILKLYDAAYAIELTDPASALACYRKGVEWSHRIDYPNGIGKGYNYAGIVHFNLGAIDSALHYAQQSLPHLEVAGNRHGYAASLNNIGNAYNVQNDYPQAISYYQQANVVFEALGEEASIIINLNNIGNLLTRSSNYDQAAGYLTDARRQAQAIGFTAGLADANNNLGSLADARGQPEQALAYCRSALQYYREIEAINFIAQAESNVGRCYYDLGDYDQALRHLQRARSMLDTLDLPREQINTTTNIGRVYNAQGNYATAIRTAEAALPQARTLGDQLFEQRLLEVLVEAHEGLDDAAGAAAYYRRLLDLSRQLFDTGKNQQLLTLERQFESEKKERQILEQQLELERRKSQNRLLAAISGLVALSAILIILWLRNRLRLNKQLAQQQSALQAQRLRELEQRQQLLAMDAALRGQEEERNRIARDLHDGLGGLMASIGMHLSAMLQKVADPDLYPIARQTGRLVDQAAGEVRRIAHNMTPSALLEDGLLVAIEEIAEGLRRSSGMQVVLQPIGDPGRLPHDQEVTLYRIVQELVQNIVRHARATKVIIQLHRQSGELNLLVEDNGQGFDPAVDASGMGMQSIAARVRHLNGALDIDSVPGEGTTVVVTVPLAD